MGDLQIKTHDFEAAKKSLKEFSEQTTTDMELRKVSSSKGFGEWLGEYVKGGGIGRDHKVTGEEFNELTTQVQNHLIDINSTHKKFIKEIGQVYNALEALDKDYIQAILISVKATEETSKGVESAQEKIKKIVEDQRKTLEILKKFKLKLEEYSHLHDIDKMWDELQDWYKELSNATTSVKNALAVGSTNSNEIAEIKGNQVVVFESIEGLKDSLACQIHRVEELSESTDKISILLAEASENERSNTIEIEQLQKTQETLALNVKEISDRMIEQVEAWSPIIFFAKELQSLKHLKQIDKLWTEGEDIKNHISIIEKKEECLSSELEEAGKILKKAVTTIQDIEHIEHLQDVGELWSVSKDNTELLAELKIENQNLHGKVRTSIYIAGGAIAISLLQFILNIVGIM